MEGCGGVIGMGRRVCRWWKAGGVMLVVLSEECPGSCSRYSTWRQSAHTHDILCP